MKLLVDIGNHRIKWARQGPAGLSAHGSCEWRKADLEATLDHAWGPATVPTLISAASVAPPRVIGMVQEWITRHWACPLHLVGIGEAASAICHGYREPRQLGIDRWLALVAAWEREHRPCCVVDCGTAITLDVITGAGVHAGGVIAPGLHTMHHALSRHAHALDAHPPAEPVLLGRDTDECIVSGCYHAACGVINELTEQVLELHGPDMALQLTGGDAEHLQVGLRHPYQHIPDLILQGLAAIPEPQA